MNLLENITLQHISVGHCIGSGRSPSPLLTIYKRVATIKFFCHDEVEQHKLQGNWILSGLLDVYRPFLSTPYDDFTQLVK